MMQFIIFSFYLCISAILLVTVPVMLHPTLPVGRKLLICTMGFFIFVPGGLAVYAFLGAPQLAVSR